MEKVIIYGGGGHAKTILNHIPGYNSLYNGMRTCVITGIIDSHLPIGTMIERCLVIAKDFTQIDWLDWDQVYNCVGGIKIMQPRKKAFEEINFEIQSANHGKISNFFHPTATQEPYVEINVGVHLMAGCYIGADTIIGQNTIINTNAVISHDCKIGAHTHICPGAILAGNVTIGEQCIIGMGVTIYAGVTIGDEIKIYNGTHVFKDILEQAGVPIPGRKN